MSEGKRSWAWAAGAAVVVVAALGLRWEGRGWWCACGRVAVWTGEAWGAHTSQQLFDPYSLTHVLHGVVLCWVLMACGRRLGWQWRLCVALALEAGWELVENSEVVIRRYREATAALGYHGDTVLNSVGDIVSCGVGFWLASRLGWRRALVLFVAVELVLLVWIRDSLLLEVLMLVRPVEAIKAWQVGR